MLVNAAGLSTGLNSYFSTISNSFFSLMSTEELPINTWNTHSGSDG